MIKLLCGPTGCGKTYQAFKRLKGRAIYTAPCRQLVYESAAKYGKKDDEIITSDIHIGNNNFIISFRTYECVTIDDLRKVKTLIIDEAHFMWDVERGDYLQKLIHFMDKVLKREVILLSATIKFLPEGTKIIRLPQRGIEFQKSEIDFTEFRVRVLQKIPTLWFCGSRADAKGEAESLKGCGVKAAAITAETPVAERVTIVRNYMQGKITCICATNAMAQGVNVPCENLYINYNSRLDDAALVIQKFGRLGRTGVTNPEATLTYCMEDGCQRELDFGKEWFQNFCFKKLEPSNSNEVPEDFDLRTPATENQKYHLQILFKRIWR